MGWTLLLLLASAMQAWAADSAERRIIGFSTDGKWFAFEQFGRQDGSGFPYHDIFVIDTINDVWAPDTPVRVRIDDETATAQQAWQQARIKAAPVLAKIKILDRGFILASSPVTEIATDPDEVRFHPHRNWTGPQPVYSLRLTQTTVPKPENCAYSDHELKIFSLSLSITGNQPEQVYSDQSLPSSRGCAHAYRISDVIIHQERQTLNAIVVLVHVFTQGFEGSDARFIAVPVNLE